MNKIKRIIDDIIFHVTMCVIFFGFAITAFLAVGLGVVFGVLVLKVIAISGII